MNKKQQQQMQVRTAGIPCECGSGQPAEFYLTTHIYISGKPQEVHYLVCADCKREEMLTQRAMQESRAGNRKRKPAPRRRASIADFYMP